MASIKKVLKGIVEARTGNRYFTLLSGVPDFFDRNKILSGGDLSRYQVPHCIRVFFHFVTRGQFWPSGIVVACVCLCVCVSVNHEFVRAITHQPFKLGSPNLD